MFRTPHSSRMIYNYTMYSGTKISDNYSLLTNCYHRTLEPLTEQSRIRNCACKRMHESNKHQPSSAIPPAARVKTYATLLLHLHSASSTDTDLSRSQCNDCAHFLGWLMCLVWWSACAHHRDHSSWTRWIVVLFERIWREWLSELFKLVMSLMVDSTGSEL